jgi:hypothetical protein
MIVRERGGSLNGIKVHVPTRVIGFGRGVVEELRIGVLSQVAAILMVIFLMVIFSEETVKPVKLRKWA